MNFDWINGLIISYFRKSIYLPLKETEVINVEYTFYCIIDNNGTIILKDKICFIYLQKRLFTIHIP